MISNVYDIFRCDPDCFGLCVVKNDEPVGIISREKLLFTMSGLYGFNLNYKKPISNIMNKDFLSVDYKTNVSSVSYMAMSRSTDKLYDFIVITEEGKYVGIVTIKDLLKKTTEMEVSVAKHQNPLTSLPGNLIIEQKLNQIISNDGQYSVAYLDINNFKSYNDVYGFENGDLVLKLLADILRSNISEREFIGHIGGDDFVVIFSNHVIDLYFEDLIRQFELEVLALYNQKDIENGFIISSNRHGEMEKFPLITLTAVVVNNKERNFKNMFELTETLAALKKTRKQCNYNKFGADKYAMRF
jgi:diguanylate cyclase (GGDEF)-like protein